MVVRHRPDLRGSATYMCFKDCRRVFTVHEPHVAELLESQSLLCNLLDLVDVEGLARRQIGDRDERTAAESGGEVVHEPGQEVAAEVVADGVDCGQLLVVEDIDHLGRHLLASIRSGVYGFVGAAVAEEVRDEDAIA